MASKMVRLRSGDGHVFYVEENVALQSVILKVMFDVSYESSDEIHIPKLTGKILSKVIEYCKKHVETPTTTLALDDPLEIWDADFVKVDQATLFDLNSAADHLKIKSLMDLTCRTLADIRNDFTPKE